MKVSCTCLQCVASVSLTWTCNGCFYVTACVCWRRAALKHYYNCEWFYERARTPRQLTVSQQAGRPFQHAPSGECVRHVLCKSVCLYSMWYMCVCVFVFVMVKQHFVILQSLYIFILKNPIIIWWQIGKRKREFKGEYEFYEINFLKTS